MSPGPDPDAPALNADGTLKDASKLDFVFSPSHSRRGSPSPSATTQDESVDDQEDEPSETEVGHGKRKRTVKVRDDAVKSLKEKEVEGNVGTSNAVSDSEQPPKKKKKKPASKRKSTTSKKPETTKKKPPNTPAVVPQPPVEPVPAEKGPSDVIAPQPVQPALISNNKRTKTEATSDISANFEIEKREVDGRKVTWYHCLYCRSVLVSV
jgi:hypothetical protein